MNNARTPFSKPKWEHKTGCNVHILYARGGGWGGGGMCTFDMPEAGRGGAHYSVIQTENRIKRTYFAKKSLKNYHKMVIVL